MISIVYVSRSNAHRYRIYRVDGVTDRDDVDSGSQFLDFLDYVAGRIRFERHVRMCRFWRITMRIYTCHKYASFS
jgi:hypothetical protein